MHSALENSETESFMSSMAENIVNMIFMFFSLHVATNVVNLLLEGYNIHLFIYNSFIIRPFF